MKNLVINQRNYFLKGETKTYQFRKKQLQLLEETIKKYEQEILDALKKDLGKSNEESILTEISVVLSDLSYTKKNLKRWMKTKRVKDPIVTFPSKSKIYNEPFGVTLIISPWNYPFQLLFNPLIGAIAAGNTVILKPSPLSYYTTLITEKIISECFNESYIKVVKGGVDVVNDLLDQKLDYIFFTGSTETGKKIMEKASKNLVPLTLELGGKSPVVITEGYDLKLAAKRIAFGKLINAGQTCIAPDYLFIKKEMEEEFIKYYFQYVNIFYSNEPLYSKNYPKIITENHLNRLNDLIEKHHTVHGGKSYMQRLEPTILTHIKLSDKVMNEEIFGPILPIIHYENLDDVINFINNKDKPLAFYLFSNNKKIKQKFVSSISFGGGTINDTLMHFVNHNLPFGGVGFSGMGSYHGRKTYLTFSHQKAVMFRGNIDLPFRYLPVKGKILKILRIFTK